MTFPIVPFTHCLENVITYTSTLNSGAALPGFIIFDTTALTYTVVSDDNANAGTYDVKLIGHSNGVTDFAVFSITITPNDPPIFATHSAIETLTAHRANTLTYTLDNDPEGDLVLFDAELWRDGVLMTPQPTWLTLNNGYLD